MDIQNKFQDGNLFPMAPIDFSLRPILRTCQQCKRVLTKNDFYQRPTSRDGLARRCRSCYIKASIHARKIRTALDLP